MQRKFLLVTQKTNWLHGLIVQLRYTGFEENGNNKHFVKNRADKIREKKEIAWRYVNTTENPADIGSRGMSLAKMGELWWKGPGCLRDSDSWPSDIKIKATVEIEKKARIIKDIMTSTILKSDVMHEILQRCSYWKFLRTASWIQRFLHNCKRLKLETQSRPLTTKEIQSSEILWVKTIQTKIQDTPQFKDNAEKLNLQLDETHRIYIWKGRITSDYPIYIPSNILMIKNLVDLPLDLTSGSRQFQVIGIDVAGS